MALLSAVSELQPYLATLFVVVLFENNAVIRPLQKSNSGWQYLSILLTRLVTFLHGSSPSSLWCWEKLQRSTRAVRPFPVAPPTADSAL